MGCLHIYLRAEKLSQSKITNPKKNIPPNIHGTIHHSNIMIEATTTIKPHLCMENNHHKQYQGTVTTNILSKKG